MGKTKFHKETEHDRIASLEEWQAEVVELLNGARRRAVERNGRLSLRQLQFEVPIVIGNYGTAPGEEEGAMAAVFSGPSFTIDICEQDENDNVRIGGKVGEDSKIDQAVFVSRGSTNEEVTTVNKDGTFEGTTFGADFENLKGKKITIGIRPKGGKGAWVYTCTVE